MSTAVHLARGFTAPAETAALLGAVESRRQLAARVSGRWGLGPRYAVVDGRQIAAELPELLRFSEERIVPRLQAVFGEPARPIADARRLARVQFYRDRGDGFRWHFDGHSFAALLALRNENGGQTQFFSEPLSRRLRPLLYALYPVPQVFSLIPSETVELAEGDLLIMRGDRILHRGHTTRSGGERILVAFAYNGPGARPRPIRDRVARLLNY